MASVSTAELESQVHLIPTALEYISQPVEDSRLGPVFRHVGADKVYILFNENPQGHDRHKDSLKAVKKLVKHFTLADQRQGIESRPINFYDFTKSVIDIYRLIYKEQSINNTVTVHLSGGTKLVAVASTFACALSDKPTKVYYVANKYGEDLESQGPIEEPFQALPPNLLSLVDIPDAEEKKTILDALVSSGEPRNLKPLLEDQGVFNRTEESESAINSRYHRHKEKLRESGLLEIDRQELKLTPTGVLVAELLEARKGAETELEEERFERLSQRYEEEHGRDALQVKDDLGLGSDPFNDDPSIGDLKQVNQELENRLDSPE